MSLLFLAWLSFYILSELIAGGSTNVYTNPSTRLIVNTAHWSYAFIPHDKRRSRRYRFHVFFLSVFVEKLSLSVYFLPKISLTFLTCLGKSAVATVTACLTLGFFKTFPNSFSKTCSAFRLSPFLNPS